MARRRRKSKAGKWVGRLLTALLTLPALYLVAALLGSIVPVNRGWFEPAEGTTIYIADNGIHADIIMPVKAEGLDWSLLLPKGDFSAPPADARWIAFGSGEKRVYLDTPTWWDLRPRTVLAALAGSKRVMHVEYVPSPYYAVRQIRPQRLGHPGYGPADAFYRASGKASAIRTCNAVAANWLRLAGIKTSLWSPFVNGLTWRYRRTPA